MRHGWRRCIEVLIGGTKVRLAGNGIGGSIESIAPGHLLNERRKRALSAEGPSLLRRAGYTVQADVKLARFVEGVAKQMVFCLSVDGPKQFVLANGMVVANCYDELRYAVMSPNYHRILRSAGAGRYTEDELVAQDYDPLYR